jgi:type IV secretion system protein VirB6
MKQLILIFIHFLYHIFSLCEEMKFYKSMRNICGSFIKISILSMILTLSHISLADNTVSYPKPKGKTPVMAEAFGGLGMTGPNDAEGRLSCVGSTSLFARLVYDALTIGVYEIARASFSMVDTGTCQNVDPHIEYKVYHYSFPFSWKWTTYSESAGDTNWFIAPPLVMKVARQSDQLCVQLWMPLLGYQNIGCKYQADTSKTSIKYPCFVANSCLGTSHTNQSLFRVTSHVIECLNDTISSIFFTSQNCYDATGNNNLNTFASFRDNMRSIVRILLTLYVIFFGMKVALGGDMPPAGEVVTFVLKMVFVIYFSVGVPYPGAVGGYQDGVSFIYTFFTTASSQLSDLMYSAGGVEGLCHYPLSLYDAKSQYLALWDSIDCRIAYYLGLNFLNSGFKNAAWHIIMGGVFGFNFIFVIALVIFFVFFISIVVHFTHVFALSLIAIAILVYMAPLFVPFALFNQTRGFFDSWIKQLISYSLQPMILTAFIALMLTIFDSQVFGSCVFNSEKIPDSSWLSVYSGEDVHLSDYYGFGIANADASDCNQTFGFSLNAATSFLKQKDLFFFTISILNPSIVDGLLTNLLTLVLFAFLFHALSNQVGLIAADITGGAPLSRMAIGANVVFDKVSDRAKSYLKSKISGKGSDNKGGGLDAQVVPSGSSNPADAQVVASGGGQSTSPGGGQSASPGGGQGGASRTRPGST